MLGAKINIIGTRPARSFVNVLDLCTLVDATGFPGRRESHWLAHEVELRSILSVASSSRNEVPRKLLKSVEGGGVVGRDLRAFEKRVFLNWPRWVTGVTSWTWKECQSSKKEHSSEALLHRVDRIVIGVTVSAVDGACSCI